jgi:hypothetical protein
MNETSVIASIAICIVCAFATGSVAFVIKSIMNDIKQAEATADKTAEFLRSEARGLRNSIEALRKEERQMNDDTHAYVDLSKGELRTEMHEYWNKAEKVLEARRMDVYQLHAKIDKFASELRDRIDDLKDIKRY